MRGFDEYLTDLYGQRTFETETQTEKVFKRHMKVGVNPDKIGILRHKETATDRQLIKKEDIDGSGAQVQEEQVVE